MPETTQTSLKFLQFPVHGCAENSFSPTPRILLVGDRSACAAVVLTCNAHKAEDDSELKLRNNFSTLTISRDGALFAFDHMTVDSKQLATPVKCYLRFRLLTYKSGKYHLPSSYAVINELRTDVFEICSGVTCAQFTVTEPRNLFNPPPFEPNFDDYCVAAQVFLDSAGKAECWVGFEGTFVLALLTKRRQVPANLKILLKSSETEKHPKLMTLLNDRGIKVGPDKAFFEYKQKTFGLGIQIIGLPKSKYSSVSDPYPDVSLQGSKIQYPDLWSQLIEALREFSTAFDKFTKSTWHHSCDSRLNYMLQFIYELREHVASTRNRDQRLEPEVAKGLMEAIEQKMEYGINCLMPTGVEGLEAWRLLGVPATRKMQEIANLVTIGNIHHCGRCNLSTLFGRPEIHKAPRRFNDIQQTVVAEERPVRTALHPPPKDCLQAFPRAAALQSSLTAPTIRDLSHDISGGHPRDLSHLREVLRMLDVDGDSNAPGRLADVSRVLFEQTGTSADLAQALAAHRNEFLLKGAGCYTYASLLMIQYYRAGGINDISRSIWLLSLACVACSRTEILADLAKMLLIRFRITNSRQDRQDAMKVLARISELRTSSTFCFNYTGSIDELNKALTVTSLEENRSIESKVVLSNMYVDLGRYKDAEALLLPQIQSYYTRPVTSTTLREVPAAATWRMLASMARCYYLMGNTMKLQPEGSIPVSLPYPPLVHLYGESLSHHYSHHEFFPTMTSILEFLVYRSNFSMAVNLGEMYVLDAQWPLQPEDTLDIRILLALASLRKSKEGAEDMVKRYLTEKANINGPDHIHTTRYRILLARIYFSGGRRQDAAKILIECVAAQTRQLRHDHPETRVAIELLKEAQKGDDAGIGSPFETSKGGLEPGQDNNVSEDESDSV